MLKNLKNNQLSNIKSNMSIFTKYTDRNELTKLFKDNATFKYIKW